MLTETEIRQKLIDCYERQINRHLGKENDDYPCSRAREESFLNGQITDYLEVLGKSENDHFIDNCIRESIFIIPNTRKDRLKDLNKARDRETGVTNYLWFAKYLPK